MPDSPPPAPDAPSGPRPGPAWRRLWPLALLLAGLGLAYALGLHRVLNLDALAAHRAALAGFATARPALALLLYLGLYILVVGASLPGATVLTLAGGLLFGPWLGAAAAVLGATLGACLVFLAARHALAGALLRRAGPRLARVAEGLRRDGFWVLLSLRLLPVLPFWLVNLAPALAGMPLAPYAGATLLGIIPATAVFAGIGAGLGQVLEAGGRPDLSVILSPGILLPLLGLAALSLLGAWWRRRRAA
ncbi:TVP38/TMEM64 family protein [Roseicella sp. DB1501]|uniref:TVP38/TMEM64 family protein n=1 Tax=Roseicella sp. DB1501 TaxID=2730925 RepID=UPI00149311D6|nr:VTT domain-containing protein [Roseicella sp. DB1501]NOG72401.1 TVP38/TMEM64 family protein [Roseicella sp. DB1501]